MKRLVQRIKHEEEEKVVDKTIFWFPQIVKEEKDAEVEEGLTGAGRLIHPADIGGGGVPRDPANVALCTVSRGYGGRGARGGGGRSRGEASVRLPLSPRTLCAPGAGGGAHVHAQGTGPGATATAATGPPGPGNNPGTEEGSGLPDEPMVTILPAILQADLLAS
ncbi:hypothetical protein WN48_02373 [Eufriesea mexicana]|nr:hypothetical protein WN48_02373 [Eufriesea mexicana]